MYSGLCSAISPVSPVTPTFEHLDQRQSVAFGEARSEFGFLDAQIQAF